MTLTPGDRAAHMALVVLREAAGETRITNGDPVRFKRLLTEARDAADKAGVDLKTVFSAVVTRLTETDEALAERLRKLSFAADGERLTDL